MYTVDDLTGILGISVNQIRMRMKAFGEPFEEHISRGAYGKTLINNTGLELLQRLIELETGSKSLATAAQRALEEFTEEEKKQELDYLSRYIKGLERENLFLREEIERLHELFHRQLDGRNT